MEEIKVQHIPITEFDPSEVENKISVAKSKDHLPELLKKYGIRRYDPFKDIALILCAMGMEKYMSFFQKKNISLDSFLNMTKSDLVDLGITDEEDTQVFLKNLKNHSYDVYDTYVSDNEVDDLQIANNIHNHLAFMQNYCAYVELQLKKKRFRDYKINSNETAKLYLKKFAECAVVQIEIMAKNVYNENSPDNLIEKFLKKNKLTLPNNLEKRLPQKKIYHSKVFIRTAFTLGIASVVIIIGKLFVFKK